MARSRSVRFTDEELSEPYRGDQSEVNAAAVVFLGAIAALAAFIWFGATADARAALILRVRAICRKSCWQGSSAISSPNSIRSPI